MSVPSNLMAINAAAVIANNNYGRSRTYFPPSYPSYPSRVELQIPENLNVIKDTVILSREEYHRFLTKEAECEEMKRKLADNQILISLRYEHSYGNIYQVDKWTNSQPAQVDLRNVQFFNNCLEDVKNSFEAFASSNKVLTPQFIEHTEEVFLTNQRLSKENKELLETNAKLEKDLKSAKDYAVQLLERNMRLQSKLSAKLSWWQKLFN